MSGGQESACGPQGRLGGQESSGSVHRNLRNNNDSFAEERLLSVDFVPARLLSCLGNPVINNT